MAYGPQPPVLESSSTVASGARPSEATTLARFLPGAMLAGRYRIVSLVGRGGMGEVYRADDLKLGQAVALKFLPAEFENVGGLLQRLLGEVRLARQVTHPNICRVHDIVEADGRHFISMEFVDGEDLATLLRRVGHVPGVRAVQVARELCAGLAAAHEQKILHRDLKPANIMLDGRGRARITDFGLAVGAGRAVGAEVLSGTPAYMAPEQRQGLEVTTRSDVYALGLVLYELFTGKPAFDAKNNEELASLQSQRPLRRPSELIEGLDLDVERAILACLEPDPSERPASALQVAASLPGASPEAVIVAAGETPSPEMVAAAGGKGALSPRNAWTLFGIAIAGLMAILELSRYSTDLGLARWTKPLPALEERARQIVAGLGYEKEPVDFDATIVGDREAVTYLANRKPSTKWRAQIAKWGPLVRLRYRQSPRPMVPVNLAEGGVVFPEDPPLSVSGMVFMEVDASGRLLRFTAVPPERDSTAQQPTAFDWDPLFAAAGLDRGRFTEVEPRWTPPVAFDRRNEWVGTVAWDPEVPLRLTAAAWRGRPVHFEVRGPWSRAERMEPGRQSVVEKMVNVFIEIVLLVALCGLALLAWRNMKMGRGDRRGATRLALFSAALLVVDYALVFHKPPDLAAQLQKLLEILFFSAGMALLIAIIYLAIEPYVRRRMPELLVAWARLLEGRIGDPRVGRDLLVGGMLGVCALAVTHLLGAVPSVFPVLGQTTLAGLDEPLNGPRMLVVFLSLTLWQSVLVSLLLFGLYFLLLLILRRRAVAIPVYVLIISAGFMGTDNPILGIAVGIAMGALFSIAALRYGLLAVASFNLVGGTLTNMPLPLDMGAAYGAHSLIVLLLLLALLCYALRISVGSRPLFRFALDE